jgi:2-phosphoglycolate phosphatase
MNATPTPLRAVLFDFDGTLADSYDAITASVNHVRAHYQLPPLPREEVIPHVGRGPGQLLSVTVPGGNPTSDAARYRAHHPSVMRQGTRLLPGVADMLAELHAVGLRLAICSNKPRMYTRDLLAYLGVAERFEVVVGPEDVPRAKPAPDMLIAALSKLALKQAEALYLGDMTVDITTARGAGLRVWVVPTGSDLRSTLEAAAPDRLLDNMAALPAALREAGLWPLQ